jgi:hypothetical protein
MLHFLQCTHVLSYTLVYSASLLWIETTRYKHKEGIRSISSSFMASDWYNMGINSSYLFPSFLLHKTEWQGIL